MKKPKVMKRHCPYCKKHTEQKISEAKNRGRSKAHPLSKFGARRLNDSGAKGGAGNQGKFSKPPIKNWKSTGKKISKKTDFRYTCQVCKKTTVQHSGIRAKKVELI